MNHSSALFINFCSLQSLVFFKDLLHFNIFSGNLKTTCFLNGSIVKWGYQDNFKPGFFFFFTKRFHAHKKHQNAKQATFLTLFCWLMFACECFLCSRNLLVKKKKKINRLEIVLITSFHYTTEFLYLVEKKNPTTTR